MIEKKFNLKYKYNIKTSFDYSKNVTDKLAYFYLPLIEINAFSLYLFLQREANNPSILDKYIFSSRIIDYLNLTVEKINAAILKLEKYGLIEVYQDKNIKLNITYLIKEPLDFKQINETKQLLYNLKQKIGEDNLIISTDYLKKTLLQEQGFELMQNDVILESKTNIENGNFKINFSELFNLMEQTGINYKTFWNKKIEEIVKNFIIINGALSIDVIRVFKYLSDNKIEINEENIVKGFYDLNSKNINSNIFVDKMEIMKNVDPIELLSITLDRKITTKEKTLITNLVSKYAFNQGIINSLIDYSLIVNDGIIVPQYIYKISDSLIENKINTFEGVVQYLKDSFKARNNKKRMENKIVVTDKTRKSKQSKPNKIEEIKDFFNNDFWGDI